jgi:two-component system sensor histidine kinase TctE
MGDGRGILAAVGRRAPGSIQARIFGAICLAVAGVTGLDLCWQYHEARAANERAHDRALARVATGYLRGLRAQDADTGRIPQQVFLEEMGATATPSLRFRVSDDKGETLGGDAALPPPADRRDDADLVTVRFYPARVAGVDYAIAMVRDFVARPEYSTPLVVQVAEPRSARVATLRAALLPLVVREGLLAAVLAALAWGIVRLGLRPLFALAELMRARDASDLTMLRTAWPSEVRSMVAAMNRLLASQRESVDQQAKFLTEASHQLRTPIAVLKTLVQSAMLGQAPAQEVLPRMLGVIDRAAGLTNQFLALAKTDQLVRRREWRDVCLEHVAKGIAVELAPLIAARRLDFSLQAADVTVRSDAWLIEQLVKNLVVNAINHSAAGSSLGIVVRRLQAGAEMIVWDHGEGVDECVLERLFEPFNVAQGSAGIGLGLSICRQIADSMEATVHLFNRIERGVAVGVDAVVRWPAASVRGQDAAGPARAHG